MNRFIPKILYREGDKEYYLNPDGKLVSQNVDLYMEYRRGELLPEVAAELDEVRKICIYPSKAAIDTVISYQKECPDKAINYIRYRYLGTCSYLDVFGPGAEQQYKVKMHLEQNERMESKIDNLQQQIRDMQQLMFNIAKSTNQAAKQRNSYRVG